MAFAAIKPGTLCATKDECKPEIKYYVTDTQMILREPSAAQEDHSN